MFARNRWYTLYAGRIVCMSWALALLPAVLLSGYFLGGERWLVILAFTCPMALLLLRLADPTRGVGQGLRDDRTGLLLQPGFDTALAEVWGQTHAGGQKSACFLVEIDDADDLMARHGQAALDQIAQSTADRILSALRDADHVARLGDARFAICLSPMQQLDLERGLQISGRLQAVLEEPVILDGLTVYVSCSVGFCLRNRAPGADWRSWLAASQLALAQARQNGPSSIRAYTPEMQARHDVETSLRSDVMQALEDQAFQAWFQPQINTDTGRVSGFEALARWPDAARGPVTPDQFLPAIAEQGQMPRLTRMILRQALQALVCWDNSGHDVPSVAVNLSPQDLMDPALPDTIAWELERFDLAPERLCLEVLETVVADAPSDITVRNLTRLHDLGCAIDLDDFGTGHASIAALKRFPVTRIKIDRSFVVKCDQDRDQQRLISALLTMAERLELETLAEGVETAGEHALLAQLGCGHVQGFGIARPMPVEETGAWLEQHHAKLAAPPQIKRRTG
ncbi:putative bifunctional diguanylate cyclase/phosphodiesterase [Aestuariivita boseongensis]|uniref:putative bifunctional diguanylate cyclase/phosphodiesterase n=1 Tax=Aestuariivita boseongensis TaxID=1470562 RepID=UPI000AECFA17|nr:GGDEF domain-containing phosphodiesterase [Aestuariivita boseongensis]